MVRDAINYLERRAAHARKMSELAANDTSRRAHLELTTMYLAAAKGLRGDGGMRDTTAGTEMSGPR